MSSEPMESPLLDRWFQRCTQTGTAWWLIVWVAMYGVLSATQLLMWLAALASIAFLLLTRGSWAKTPGARVYWILLACFLVPGLLSLPGAVDAERAVSTNARLLAYGLAGFLFLRLAPTEKQWPTTVMWLTGVLLLWCLDGMIQEWRGVSLSGYPLFTGLPEGHKVTGSMGLDYGPHLAVLSPLLFEAVRMHGRRLPMLWLAVPVLVTAVSLSASRYSLFLLLVSAAAFLPLWARALGWRGTLILLAGVSVGLMIPVVALPHLAERLFLALGSLSLNPEDYNTGFAFRPELWRASWIVFLENWLNGVGIRGSGLAMEPILAASLIFPESLQSQLWHPHLGVLEIAADTGIIGVVGYGVFLLLMCRAFFKMHALENYAGATFLLVAFLALFPFSSALSMYSFPTGGLAWPALALALGGHFGRR